MRTLALGALAVLAFVPSACGDDRPPAARTAAAPAPRLEKTFTSPRYGYTVRFPADWSAQRAGRALARDELVSSSSDSVDRLSEDPRGSGRPMLTVGAQPVAEGTDLAATTKRQLEEQVGCRPRSETSLTVGGEQARVLSYPACATLDIVWTVLVRGSSGFHIVWWSEQGRAAADRPLYDAILGSFAFD